MYLKKGPRELQMQLCHKIPGEVRQTIDGFRPNRGTGAASSSCWL